MKKTQHYGLCQWDGEDRILREDFNEDNAKLDTAIAEVKERNYFEKLADVTTTQSCQQLDVDLSGVDFTQYDRLIIHPMIKTDTVDTAFIRLNGRADTIYSNDDYLAMFCAVYNSKAGAGKLELILDTFLFGSSYMVAPGDSIPKVSESFVVVKPETVTPKNLTQLNFYCASSRPVLSGTKVRVYGVRA